MSYNKDYALPQWVDRDSSINVLYSINENSTGKIFILQSFFHKVGSLFSLTALMMATVLAQVHYRDYASAAPGHGTIYDISSSSIQQALEEGKINDLIAMVGQADQHIADLENTVEVQRQKVNLAMEKVRAALEATRIAKVSVKSLSAEQKKTEQEAQKAKADLDKSLRQAYMSGINPTVIDLLVSGSSVENDLVEQSTVLKVLISQAQRKYQRVLQLNNETLNSYSLTSASKIQAQTALAHALKEKRKAEQSLSASISSVNAARDQRRELELQRSLAQAAYDAAQAYKDNTNERMHSYQSFRQGLAVQLVKESGVTTAKRRVVITGKHTRTVEALTQFIPQGISTSASDVINSIPFLKDLPGVGLLTGSRTIDPVNLAMQSVNTFVSSATSGGGDLVNNVLNGAIKAIQVPIGGISQALGLESLGIPGLRTNYTPSAQHPFLRGSPAVEAVVARGMSAIGTPYAWGGGSTHGPTRGIHDGGVADRYGDYRKIGFDCSGLMVYSFAAAGIVLPHYSGYQYRSGPRFPLAQMKRGDMIFYGPGGSQHVALILGDGNMLEAPESGKTVHTTPVRTSGAEPFVVRMFV